MEDKEISNIYAIPANYTDSGKLLGGMIDTRNAVETVFLLLLVGAPELLWIPMSGTIRVVVMTVTLLPLGVVSLMGWTAAPCSSTWGTSSGSGPTGENSTLGG